VALALERAGLEGPSGYEPALVYRRCPSCSRLNIVKNGVLECCVCDADLPVEWNLGDG
jgi:hypothetical protein